MPSDPVDAKDRGIGEIFRDLAGEVQSLVRGEIALARIAVSDRLKSAGPAAAVLGAAVVLALAGLIVIVEGVAAVLAVRLPTWAALLITGGVVIISAVLLAKRAIGQIRNNVATVAEVPKEIGRDFQKLQDELR